MSTLVVFLPDRPRLRAGDTPPAPRPEGLDWVLLPAGGELPRSGHALPERLPEARQTLAVLGPRDIAWHRLPLPKAPAARLADALQGLLEDALLDEAARSHLALAPEARPGQPTWIAAADAAQLQAELARLEAAGRPVERLVPALPPALTAEEPARLWLQPLDGPDDANPPRLLALHAGADGVQALPLGSPAARALLPADLDALRIDAPPAAVQAAETLLGRPVRPVDRIEQARDALASPWNLRQFGLAARHRGWQRLGSVAGRLLQDPAWRPARWGLAALLLVQLLGLNLLAWQEERALQAQRAAVQQLLRDSFPQTRVVLDAPRQMQQATEGLRQQAGEPGPQDLEPALAALAAVWPGDDPPQSLHYDGRRLSISHASLDAATGARLQTELQAAGWAVELAAGRLSLQRGSAEKQP